MVYRHTIDYQQTTFELGADISVETEYEADRLTRAQQDIYVKLEGLEDKVENFDAALLGPIGTDDLVDGSVTNVKLADSSITGSKIVNGTITADKLEDDSITGIKLKDNIIDGDKIIDGSITNDELSSNSVSSDNIIDGSITSDKFDVTFPANSFVDKNGNAIKVVIGRAAELKITDSKGNVTMNAVIPYGAEMIADNNTKLKNHENETSIYHHFFLMPFCFEWECSKAVCP